MLSQKLQLKLQQKLSPQQIQLMKLLQVPTFALEQRIKQEIEENPALEESEGDEANEELQNDFEENNDTDNENENEEENDEQNPTNEEEFSLNDYIDEEDEDIPSYKLTANNTSADDERKEIPYASGITFHEQLLAQLGLRKLDERGFQIGANIIGNIDDSGYLQREISALVNDLAFLQNISATEDEVNELLALIQEFDPPGVGARNLQECLLLQLYRINKPDNNIHMAIEIVSKCFEDFTKKHYDKIAKKLNTDEEELREGIQQILKLNPKPGNTYYENYRTPEYIIPDFVIHVNNGSLELALDGRNAPDLKVSKVYSEMLQTYAKSKEKNSGQKEAFSFVKQKVDSAIWFIDALKQRQDTLLNTMSAIMEYQKEYFLEGDETLLKPMILKDIAEKVNLDISTISRVANSKYVLTPYGVFPLKSFFSESMSTESGEEVSTREVKKILQDCVNAENKKKPLTDDELALILKEKGYSIARRTVAKYREQLNIPVARLRKKY